MSETRARGNWSSARHLRHNLRRRAGHRTNSQIAQSHIIGNVWRAKTHDQNAAGSVRFDRDSSSVWPNSNTGAGNGRARHISDNNVVDLHVLDICDQKLNHILKKRFQVKITSISWCRVSKADSNFNIVRPWHNVDDKLVILVEIVETRRSLHCVSESTVNALQDKHRARLNPILHAHLLALESETFDNIVIVVEVDGNPRVAVYKRARKRGNRETIW